MAERGELVNPRPSTLQKFDTGLSWKPGSAAQVFWQGSQPLTLGRATYKPGPGNIAVGLDPLMQLLAAQKDIHAKVVGLDDGTVGVEGLNAALGQLDSAVSAIAGVFVTETLERNHGQTQKVLDRAIAALLQLPVEVGDSEYEEKLYRRWLFGAPIEVDAATIKRFSQRLKDSQTR